MKALFNDRKIYDLANAISSSIDNQIKKIDNREFANSTIDELTESLFQKYKMEIPSLLEDKIYMKSPEDIKIPINRRTYGGQSVDGTKFTFIIPFKGESHFFSVFPTTSLNILPYAEVDLSELKIIFKVPVGNDTSRIRNEFDENLNNITKYLGFLDDDIKSFNAKLPVVIKAALQRRKDKLDNDAETANGFGFPIK